MRQTNGNVGFVPNTFLEDEPISTFYQKMPKELVGEGDDDDDDDEDVRSQPCGIVHSFVVTLYIFTRVWISSTRNLASAIQELIDHVISQKFQL